MQTPDMPGPGTPGTPGRPDTPGNHGTPGSPASPGNGGVNLGASKIRHSSTRLGKPELDPVPVVEATGPATGGNKITVFGKEKKHEEVWSRTPNTTGTGAIHVKTFHSKLTDDALVYMDQCVNEWLDGHPQYEVKFVNTSVGVLTGKTKEPHLICQLWV